MEFTIEEKKIFETVATWLVRKVEKKNEMKKSHVVCEILAI